MVYGPEILVTTFAPATGSCAQLFLLFSFFTSTWKVTLQETLYYNRNVIFECFKQDVYFLKKYGNPGFLLYLEKSGHSHEIL